MYHGTMMITLLIPTLREFLAFYYIPEFSEPGPISDNHRQKEFLNLIRITKLPANNYTIQNFSSTFHET